jgi:thiamine-monophosphate kinase
LVLRASAIPIHPAVTEDLSPGASPGQGENGGPAPLHFSLEGGEDFELCFTAPPESVADWVGPFQETFGLPLTKVGWVREGEGLCLETLSGGVRPLEERGFSHFSHKEIG